MDFAPSDEEALVAETARAFATRELGPRAANARAVSATRASSSDGAKSIRH